MALRKSYQGSVGPHYYDDTLEQVPASEADLTDSPLDPWTSDVPSIGNPYLAADPTPQRAFRSEGVADGTIGDEVVTVDYVTQNAIRFVTVPDIDNPDLSAYSGAFILAREANANEDECTLYIFDATVGTGANPPFVVTGDGGFWIALLGKYGNGKLLLRRDLVIQIGQKLIFGSNELCYLDPVSDNQLDLYVNSTKVLRLTAT